MKIIKTVFIVEEGEDSEGGSINGVFSTREAAFASVAKRLPHCAFRMEQVDDMRWHGGCDWLKITEYPIEDLT